MRRNGTPPWWGYLVIWIVAVVVCANLGGLYSVITLGGEDSGRTVWTGAMQFFLVLPLAIVYVAVLSTPAALIGLPLLHLLTRRASDQRVPVALAALIGLASGGALDAMDVTMPIGPLPLSAVTAGAVALVAVATIAPPGSRSQADQRSA